MRRYWLMFLPWYPRSCVLTNAISKQLLTRHWFCPHLLAHLPQLYEFQSWYPSLGDHGIWTHRFGTLIESNQLIKDLYLSLLSQALNITIGQGLVDSVSGKCHWVGYQVMVLVGWFPNGAPLASHHQCAQSQVGIHIAMILDVARTHYSNIQQQLAHIYF